MKTINIWCDGACLGNPGPGGVGYHIEWPDGKVTDFSCNEKDSTNNRMELTAAILSIGEINEPSIINLYTDSKYVGTGLTSWMKKWKDNGWKTASKQDVKNKDLWVMLDEVASKHQINFIWVKGHSTDVNNILVDKLASSAAHKVGK